MHKRETDSQEGCVTSLVFAVPVSSSLRYSSSSSSSVTFEACRPLKCGHKLQCTERKYKLQSIHMGNYDMPKEFIMHFDISQNKHFSFSALNVPLYMSLKGVPQNWQFKLANQEARAQLTCVLHSKHIF